MKLRVGALAAVTLLASFGLVTAVAAQDDAHDLRVSRVDVTEIGHTSSVVRYEALVEVVNEGDADFDGIAKVDYQIDGGDRSLVYIITELASGDTARFTFRFDLAPGDRTLSVLIGDAAHQQQITVTAADLNVAITGEQLLRGGMVELEFNVWNNGDRTAEEVGLSLVWEEIGGDGTAGSLELELQALEPEDSETVSATIEISPGIYRFQIAVSTSTVESVEENNKTDATYEIEFVELGLKLVSSEALRWHTDGVGLMSLTMEITNTGVDDSGSVTLGVECADDACIESQLIQSIAAGEVSTTVLETWMPVGDNTVTLYVGANDDGFRWGDSNVIQASVNVAEVPPLEWALIAVSEMQGIQYWSDGSANVVFETTMENVGSELVSGDLTINIDCELSDDIEELCGGDYIVEVDPAGGADVTRHTLRVPQGTTALYFSHGDSPVVETTAIVQERILGIDRAVWDCFQDTSNVGRDVRDDLGVGCGGWRNEFIIKWPIGEPIRIWVEGDDDYKGIFDRVLSDLGPFLNVEFEPVNSKSKAQLSAYLGLRREGTSLEHLRCNRAAGCAWFEIAADRSIQEAEMVVWPPLTAQDEVARDHLIYSVALHELIHVLAGMLHRHDDRTSVMSYDALDYKTLSDIDTELLRIASHPLVEPGTHLNEIGNLIVFEDELVDPPVEIEPSIEDVLRRAHARLMDEGSANFVISGGWPSCNFEFGPTAYSIGGIRPRAPRWVHIENDDISLYIIRAASPIQSIEYWLDLNGQWQRIPNFFTNRRLSFRDSFSNPLALLSSINIYGDGSNVEVLSREGGTLKLEYELEGADVRIGWSESTNLDIRVEIETDDYTILSYEMDWTFEPEEEAVCDTYRVNVQTIDYGSEFKLPDAIRSNSPIVN